MRITPTDSVQGYASINYLMISLTSKVDHASGRSDGHIWAGRTNGHTGRRGSDLHVLTRDGGFLGRLVADSHLLSQFPTDCDIHSVNEKLVASDTRCTCVGKEYAKGEPSRHEHCLQALHYRISALKPVNVIALARTLTSSASLLPTAMWSASSPMVICSDASIVILSPLTVVVDSVFTQHNSTFQTVGVVNDSASNRQRINQSPYLQHQAQCSRWRRRTPRPGH